MPSEPRPGTLRRRDLAWHLLGRDCILQAEGANHSWWWNPALNRRSALPRHPEINDVLARKICRDLGIPNP